VIQFGAPAGLGGGPLWVSATTFLPVRLRQITATPYGRIAISFEFSVLPPTGANQALLGPLRIPAGFARHSLPG
jgi:hypothetical protein